MTTTHHSDLGVATPSEKSWYRDFTMAASTKYWAAVARIMLGSVFLWAFLDKFFGLKMATPSGQGWYFGAGDGDPTFGFLKFGTNPDSAWAGVFTGLRPGEAPDPMHWTNWLFMLGLLGIGVAFVFGIFMRIGAISGAVLLVLMYLAAAPIWVYNVIGEDGSGSLHHPLIDDHIVYAVAMIMLMLFEAGRTWGFGKVWESTSLVKKHPWLA